MSQSFKSWMLILCGVILLCLVPLWLFWVVPYFSKIPDDFKYTADILSIDNFYEQQVKKFEGEHISKTTFSYEVVKVNPDHLVIKNRIEVRKLSNKPIFYAERYYYINPYNGQHIKERNGYLFAPRSVNKQNFYYWHVNYNAPALMKFANEEKIDGLSVYRYVADYTADQSENLKYLSDPSLNKGIKANVHLQLWIEPVSGWLVKYQDNTIAYYYDKKTGAIVSPWNQFSNRYTNTSVHAQVAMAEHLKTKILMVNYAIPILLAAIGFFLIAVGLIKKEIRLPIKSSAINFYLSLCGVIILLVVAVVLTLYQFVWHGKKSHTFKIGITKWSDIEELNTRIKGFKAGLAEYGFYEGKNLKFIIRDTNDNIENQINAIQYFIKRHVDMIVTMTTPGTLIAKGITTETPIIFSGVIYPEESNVMDVNVVGVANYIAPAQQFFRLEQIYSNIKVLGFVHHKGDPDSEIQYQEFKNMLNRRGIDIVDIAGIDAEDLTNHLSTATHYDALYFACDTLMQGKGGELAAKYSLAHKIPSLSCYKESVNKGALLSYTADSYNIGKIAGKKAAFILRGAEPGWLYTETPEKGSLIINSSTAKALGVQVNADLLQQADEIIK